MKAHHRWMVAGLVVALIAWLAWSVLLTQSDLQP